MRDSHDDPTFVDSSPAGWFKGKDSSVINRGPRGRAWVRGARVIDFGKAGAGATGRGGLKSGWMNTADTGPVNQ